MMKRLALALAALIALSAASYKTVGTSVAPNEVDATTYPGSDMCAQISAAAIALNAKNPLGGTVNATGFTGEQTCAASMFASWPGMGFNVKLGNVLIDMGVPTYVPAYSLLEGQKGSNIPNAVGTRIRPWHGHFPITTLTVNATGCTGSTITVNSTAALTGQLQGGIGYAATGNGILPQAMVVSTTATTVVLSNAVTCVNTNVITFVAPVIGLGAAAGDTYQAQVERLAVTCIDDTGVAIAAGSIGMQNIQAEERSWFKETYIINCQTAYDIEGTGSAISLSGPQNSGPYISIHAGIPTSLITLASYKCIKVGGAPFLLLLGQSFIDVSCDGGAGGTGNTISIDAASVTFIGGHTEFATDAIIVGSLRTAHNIVIANMTCATGVSNSCVRLSNTVGSDSISINGITSPTGTNIFQDDQTNGCTVTGAQLGSAYAGVQYWRGGNNVVWSPDTGCQNSWSENTAVSGAGTTTSNATVLDTSFIENITTCAAAAGVRLPAKAGYWKLISNTVTGNACLLYPPSGGVINAGATDAALSLAAKTGAICFTASTTVAQCATTP